MNLLHTLLLFASFWPIALRGQAERLASSVHEIERREAPVAKVLESYAQCSGRTLLRHPLLPAITLTLRASPTNSHECAKLLVATLATNGIAVIADGEKFALVVPKSYVPYVQVRSAEIKPPAQGAGASETFPAVAIVMDGADLTTVAGLYAEMRGRKINPADWAREIPRPNFFFKNQTPLTKAEVLYAYDTLFEWCGLKMVTDGDDFLKPELIRRK